MALTTGQVPLTVKSVPSKGSRVPLKFRTYLTTGVILHCDHVPVIHVAWSDVVLCLQCQQLSRAMTANARRAVRESWGWTQALAVEALGLGMEIQ